MLRTHIGVDGIGPRARFWLRRDLRQLWEGPFFSYDALAQELHRAGCNIRIEQLQYLIEDFPRGVSTAELVIIREPFICPPGKGLNKALGIKPPKTDLVEAKAVKELLQTLAPGQTAVKSRVRKPRDIVQGKIICPSNPESRVTITGAYREKNLKRLATRRAAQGVVFNADISSADLSFSNFFKTEFNGLAHKARLADCALEDTHLAADFGEACFAGSHFERCQLVRNFQGADMKRIQFSDCEIATTASFRGADLRGSNLWVRSEHQIRAAIVGPNDPVCVCATTIELCRERYLLAEPAQRVPGVRIASNSNGYSNETYVSRAMFKGPTKIDRNAVLWDFSHIREFDWSNTVLDIDTPLRAIAPKKAFGGLSETDSLALVGRYDYGWFKRCEFEELELRVGSFRYLDLSGIKVELLSVCLTNTDLHELTLPVEPPGSVLFFIQDFMNYSSLLRPEFSLSDDLPRLFLRCWNSAAHCDWLAKELLRAAWKDQNSGCATSTLASVLSSWETTPADIVERLHFTNRQLAAALNCEASAAFYLVARRNLLNAYDRLGFDVNHW